MNRNRLNTGPRESAGGLTFVEVLVSIVVVVLLAGLLLPLLAKSKARSKRINCVSNLKLVGLAFRMWSGDHGEKFPWNVSTTNGGTMEFAGIPGAFRHYLAVSNELTSPKVLKCDSDAGRTKATSWGQLTSDSRHLSYFVGLDADETKPNSILSGDRHITTNGVRAVGLVTIPMSSTVGWSSELHRGFGNLGLGDGSAHQASSSMAQRQVGHFLTNYASSIRLVIP